MWGTSQTDQPAGLVILQCRGLHVMAECHQAIPGAGGCAHGPQQHSRMLVLWVSFKSKPQCSWIATTKGQLLPSHLLLPLLDLCPRLKSAVPAWLQLQGGGLVPLSHAICCRPCLPEELPDSGGRISPDEKGVAIVSIGCHAATGERSADQHPQ